MEKKRLLSLILSILMLVTLIIPVNAFAEEYEEVLFEEPIDEGFYEEPVYEEVYDEPVYEEAYEEPVYEVFSEEPVYDEFSGEESIDEAVIVDEPASETLEENQVILEDEKENAQVDETGDAEVDDEETEFFELSETAAYNTDSTISITAEPENAKANVGDSASFSVVATGVSTYQWQYSANGETRWRNCGEASAKNATYEIAGVTAAYKDLYYRCLLTGTDGTIQYTKVVRIDDKSEEETFAITTEPENAKANVGDSASFSVVATGVSTYQWQYSTNGETRWRNCGEASATNATYEIAGVTAAYKGLYYRCFLTGTDGTTLNTKVVRIEDKSEEETFAITTEPENAKANVGDSASFSVEATGVAAYQWQYSTDGETRWRNCGEASAKNATYEIAEVTAAYKGLYYRCFLTGTDGTTLNTKVVRIDDADIVSGSFVFQKIDGSNNLRLIGYTGNDSSITVPNSVEGMIVTEIGVSPLPDGEKGVFEDNTTLTSITLPNSITAIRERSFKGCTSLSTMSTY